MQLETIEDNSINTMNYKDSFYYGIAEFNASEGTVEDYCDLGFHTLALLVAGIFRGIGFLVYFIVLAPIIIEATPFYLVGRIVKYYFG